MTKKRPPVRSEKKADHIEAWDRIYGEGYRAGLEAAAAIPDGYWQRPSSLLLACGEMTAQEMRTAKAILVLVENQIRALAKAANDAGKGKT
jgi:hypothetical protein